uniref:Uncharacterized protein n=1 Tax=uncultured marine virus TaxID=186617 RepID=A0A0F7LA83_9VIRU|nr:hypothetical protein [uncultured marine virus]
MMHQQKLKMLKKMFLTKLPKELKNPIQKLLKQLLKLSKRTGILNQKLQNQLTQVMLKKHILKNKDKPSWINSLKLAIIN